MFIELVDVLRCLNAHEETWLVLAAERMKGRHVVDGVLGCPICRAEYPISAGVAHFGRSAPAETPSAPPDENETVRLAALLDLTDARGCALLVGETGIHAPRLRDFSDVQLLLVDPPPGIEMRDGISGLTTPAGPALPLAAGSARGVAVDDEIQPERLQSALEVLTAGGRIVAPIALIVPSGATELARDDRHWVAERMPAPRTSGIVSLHRRE